MSQLRLYLLGPPEVRLEETRLVFPTRKTLALLVYLVVEGGLHPREQLAALLWPAAGPQRSRATLRNTLGRLQAVLQHAPGQTENAYLDVTPQALAFNPGADIILDLHTVERAYAVARADRARRAPPEGSASQALLQSAVDCYRDDFLSGFSLGDAPGFEEWIGLQREMWRRRLGLILDRLSEIQFASGELAHTVETAARWIALDPLDETAYRRKMRAHFAAGERRLALQTYEACHAVLAAELRVAPSPDTVALAARIRAQIPLPKRPAPQPDHLDTPVRRLENLFAGRTAEHRALVERYQRVAAGRPQAVILRGEAGIGKTRLAREFVAWAIAEGAEVLSGGAFESGARMPFQPLMEAFGPLLERENAPEDLLADTWLVALGQLFPELLNRYPDLPAPDLETPAARTQLFEALVRLSVALAARAPLVLFMDDLQWADRATLDWLQYAARRWRQSSARVLLLVSLRSEALYPSTQPPPADLIESLAQVAREVESDQVELAPLSERDTVGLVQSLLVPHSDDFAQWVYGETHGQPFYLMETLKDLLDRGVLHPKWQADGQTDGQADGRWAFEVDAEHDLGKAARVPSTVGAVIRSRLNRLSPNAFSLLAAGAVLDQHLTFERLCGVSNLTADAALPALDELVSGRLLLEVAQPGTVSTYAFAHHMIRDVVYTEAGDARRRLFHQRALGILEADQDPPAALAHHALAAGMAEAAFRHSLNAGNAALRLSIVSEAVVHFENARQLAREALALPFASELVPLMRELYLHLGRAYELNGQHDQARSVHAEMEALMGA